MNSSETRERKRLLPFVIVAGFFLLVLHGLLYHLADGSIADRILRDTDAYSWMNRVLRLVGEGGWYDHVQPRINPPEGHVQHWTRPFDALLWAGGALLGILVGFRDGLFYWGVSVSPLLHAGVVLVMLAAVRPLVGTELLSRRRLPLLLLVLLSQVAIYQPFLAGRPDHHAPLAFLFVLQLAFWLRLVRNRGSGSRDAALLGGTHALALWINPEAMLYIVMIMASLLAHWLWTGDHRVSRQNMLYGIAIAVGMWLALLAEWGPALPSAREMDVVSLPHGMLMLLVAGFWGGLYWATGAGKATSGRLRLAWTVAGAAALFALILPAFPEFLADPLGEMDPLYRDTRLARITELQTLWSFSDTWIGGVGNTIMYLGAPVCGSIFLLVRMAKAESAELRLIHGTFFVLIMVYLALSLRQARWTDYLALSSVIPYTLLAVALLRRWDPEATDLRTRLTRAPATFGVIFGPVLLGLGLMGPGGGEVEPSDRFESLTAAWDSANVELPPPVAMLPSVWTSGEADMAPSGSRPCSLVPVAELLNDSALVERESLVMAHADYGPELLYRTSHSVLSIPNHRPQPGYRLTREILDNPSRTDAEELLMESDVDIVLLCLRDVTTAFFGGTGTEDLYVHDLVRGRIPDGFELLGANEQVRLYRRTR